ncbi:MAG TPA: ATP-binding protein [Acidobacteriaceae bacterium]|nr:ATP-binding protein [Acidobacteriaceae bacterium]
MRGLFFKIFAIFWIAQSLIFVITTALILRHRRPSPQILFQTLSSTLRNEATNSLAAWQSGGCAGFEAYAAAHSQRLALADGHEKLLCGAAVPASWDRGTNPESGDQIVGAQFGDHYVWRVPTTTVQGERYIFYLSRPHVPDDHPWYQDLLHFAFPQLFVAIVVGGVTTYALVLLFTRPLVRLRQAARELAQGNLKTRVQEPGRGSPRAREDEFKALVHDFNHMADRLESMVDAHQLLLRDVSHELRSPLARLSVALELAREDAAPEMAAHLDRIEREGGRLNQLIGQLLTLSSIESVDRAIHFQPVSLNRLIGEMVPDAEYEARQRGSSVGFTAEGDCVIEGNRELLYRAIENIVRNAVRYTEPGTAVEIHLQESERQGRREALLEISDRGPGIPDAEIQDIFRPFYRVDRARSNETGGFGVGLAIAERAVKLHGGMLSASNRPGGGATIRLCFTMPVGSVVPGGSLPGKL